MTRIEKKRTKETKMVEKVLREHFPKSDCYRQNSVSIRVRVIDDRFERLTRGDRERMVQPHLDRLPDGTQSDITLLLLLAPSELPGSLMNLEFEDPVESAL